MNLKLRALKIDDQTFESIAKANSEWNFEQTAEGELVIVPPTGGTSGRKNSSLTGQLDAWVEANLSLGESFDSSTLFVLPNGAKRSPDASWVARQRWDALTQQQQDGYPPLCPDFVVELRSQGHLHVAGCPGETSAEGGFPAVGNWRTREGVAKCPPTDSLEELQAKMQEYMDNGARLGWLINPQDRQVEIYRPGQEVEVLQSPINLSGGDVLPGFVLSLQRIN